MYALVLHHPLRPCIDLHLLSDSLVAEYVHVEKSGVAGLLSDFCVFCLPQVCACASAGSAPCTSCVLGCAAYFWLALCASLYICFRLAMVVCLAWLCVLLLDHAWLCTLLLYHPWLYA